MSEQAEPFAAFAKALAAFQESVPAIGKDQTAQAGQYSYSYADLTTITARAFPLLAKHGLSFTSRPTLTTEQGFVLAYSLLHVDGHREAGLYPLPDPAKTGAQQLGSAITYSRRYSFCAVTGIAPGGEDDDGQAAAETRTQPVAVANGGSRPHVPVDPVKAVKARLWVAAQARGMTADDLLLDFAASHEGEVLETASVESMTKYAETLEAVKA